MLLLGSSPYFKSVSDLMNQVSVKIQCTSSNSRMHYIKWCFMTFLSSFCLSNESYLIYGNFSEAASRETVAIGRLHASPREHASVKNCMMGCNNINMAILDWAKGSCPISDSGPAWMLEECDTVEELTEWRQISFKELPHFTQHYMQDRQTRGNGSSLLATEMEWG